MLSIIFLLIIFCLIYICLCVSSTEYTTLGKIKLKLANIAQTIYKVLPTPCQTFLYSKYDYLFNKPNPVVQIIYIFLVLALFYFFHAYGIEKIFPHKNLSMKIMYPTYLFLALSLYSFYLSSTIEPGIITKKNSSTLKLKYNHPSLFGKNSKNDCTKCKIPIIPRSKHCYVCDKCIEKFDHHCIWVNQCIGAKNYRFFILFLFSHCILTFYAGGVGLLFLYYYIKDNNLLKATFYKRDTQEKVEGNLGIVLKYVMGNNYAFFCTVIMLIVIAIMLLIFMLYHFYLIKLNLTTNERNKQVKTLRTMKMLKEILIAVSKTKNFKLFFKELTGEEIQKYKRITFEEPETDLDIFNENEINTFYNFAEQSIFIFRKNPYDKGFYQCFLDIMKGQ